MVTGLALQAVGYVWVAARGGLATGWGEFVAALFVAGIGISFALPTVPTAVLDSVAEAELGKASGVNYMAARFGSVLAVAIAGAVFAVDGSLGSPASVTAGFRPAIWACAGFAVLAAISALGLRDRGPAPLAEGASAVLTA
jgi:MFS family permease